MKLGDILELYDQEYAAHYNDRFLLGDAYRDTTEYEVQLLQGLLASAENWLDVACGTGYMLSRFPGVRRLGCDLSSAMLEVAMRENPDVDFVLCDFLDDRPEWRNQWDLVSCMWQAYSYLDMVEDVLHLIDNLASWTSVGGTCFLPICDLEAVIGQELPHRQWLDTLDGTLQVDAIVWSCLEPSGRRHLNLIAPHRELFVRTFKKYFERVHIIDYPRSNQDAVVSRPRAVVAQGRL